MEITYMYIKARPALETYLHITVVTTAAKIEADPMGFKTDISTQFW